MESWTKGKMVVVGDAAHPMLPRMPPPRSRDQFWTGVTNKNTDQGQGGAQGIEDGISLGIALCGAGVNQVAQRLAVFKKARRHRASAIQVMSNAGQEQWEMIHDEVAKYVENVPSKSLPGNSRLSWAF